jgi:hypothetical protein
MGVGRAIETIKEEIGKLQAALDLLGEEDAETPKRKAKKAPKKKGGITPAGRKSLSAAMKKRWAAKKKAAKTS